MKFSIITLGSAITAANAAVLGERATTPAVVGKPVGFASKATGGGAAACKVPADSHELVKWISDDTPRCIVLDKKFEVYGEDKKMDVCKIEVGADCKSGTAVRFKMAINNNGYCDSLKLKTTQADVDQGSLTPRKVGSNKSIIGVKDQGELSGGSWYLGPGTKNVIMQNIRIAHVNSQFKFGGDGIVIDGAEQVWIDHVKVSAVGDYLVNVKGTEINTVTLSNNDFTGSAAYSATCNDYHNEVLRFSGEKSQVTMVGNYIHHTSGNSPAVEKGTLVHAVNNYFDTIVGHAFNLTTGANVLTEGNYFSDVTNPSLTTDAAFFGDKAPLAGCKTDLGRSCKKNEYKGSSGTIPGDNVSFLSKFKGQSIPPVSSASKNPAKKAGYGVM